MQQLKNVIGTTNRESPSGVFALTVLRVVAGVIMTAHGWQKLTGFAQWKQSVVQMGIPLPEVAAPLAVAGELAGGLGLLVGLLTPIAAFGVLATMTVAILSVHLPHGLFAKDNGFEYPLTLLAVSLFFLTRGPGPFSLDALWARDRKRGELSQPRSPQQHPGTAAEQRT